MSLKIHFRYLFTMEVKKRAYSAWWALPFSFQESNGSRPIRILMMGFHKPSTLGSPTKPDVVLVKENNEIEAIPFAGQDLVRVAAGIIVCSSKEKILQNAKMTSDLIAKRKTLYREFNIHKMETIDALRLAGEHGENWNVSHKTFEEDILLLKGAYSYGIRKGHNTTVHNLLSFVKDIRYNIPVILFKKSYKNFGDIMWLWDGGVRFLAGLFFLVNYPPKGDTITFLSDYELSTGIKLWLKKLSSQNFIQLNSRQNISQIVNEVKLINDPR